MSVALRGLGDDLPALGEVGRFYAVLAVLAAVAGFVSTSLLVGSGVVDLGTAQPGGQMWVASDTRELLFILGNNLGFFLLISVLPGVNAVLVGVQVFSLGRLVFLIHELPFESQVMLLYRHSLFEVVALGLAVTVSYVSFFAVKRYAEGDGHDPAKLFVAGRVAGLLYLGILACTLVGAILEGLAVVRV